MPEFITKAIEVLKIPLKILLPSLWIFSGLLLFTGDVFLEQINLSEWTKENGFVFGLIFIICSSLILVYVFYFAINFVIDACNKLTSKRRLFKQIMNLNDVEMAVIAKIYSSSNYTAQFDYNQPIIQGLLTRNFIHCGGEQRVVASKFSSQIPMNFTLQPPYMEALDKYVPKMKNEMDYLRTKLTKIKNYKKKEECQAILDNGEHIYKLFKGI